VFAGHTVGAKSVYSILDGYLIEAVTWERISVSHKVYVNGSWSTMI